MLCSAVLNYQEPTQDDSLFILPVYNNVDILESILDKIINVGSKRWLGPIIWSCYFDRYRFSWFRNQ